MTSIEVHRSDISEKLDNAMKIFIERSRRFSRENPLKFGETFSQIGWRVLVRSKNQIKTDQLSFELDALSNLHLELRLERFLRFRSLSLFILDLDRISNGTSSCSTQFDAKSFALSVGTFISKTTDDLLE